MNEQIVGRYKIIRMLGAGAMGQVYLAEDLELGRKAALKFLSPQYSAIPDFKARFKREARSAATLNHPNIITIYEVGEQQNRAWIAMEYVDGESLQDWVGGQELPMSATFDIAMQICEGLGEAHRAGITHRDLKPANVLIDKKGRVKIADFGLARLEGVTQLTSEGAIMGTPAYMSPEQVRGKKLDNRSDIFSLGVVIYEMLARRLPFPGENEFEVFEAIKNQQPEPLARYKAGVSEGLQRIIDKALDKDRDTRYQHVEDLLADLRRERKSLAAPISSFAPKPAPPTVEINQKPAPKKPPARPVSPSGKTAWPILLSVAAIVALVVTTIVLVRNADDQGVVEKGNFYSAHRNDGDVLFRQGKYSDAKQKYQDALKQKPGDSYVTEQIKTCDQKLKEEERERLYAKFIDEADAFFNQGSYSEAKRKYEEALTQKPGDRYAASRKQSCEEAISKRAETAEQERQYASLIDAADNLFRRSKYADAKAKYQQALDYKRDDKYAAQQIRECDRLIAKAEEEKKIETAAPPKIVERPQEPKQKEIPGMELIPGGYFLMGSNDGDNDEKPEHQVYVDAFYMDKYEVTVADYQRFLDTVGRQNPDNWAEQLRHLNHPVVNVSWEDANAYARWVKKRLPTEAEWEYAARGGNTGMGGKPKYEYPWGDQESHDQANYSGTVGKDQWGGTSPVGSFPPNRYELYDVAGNVWEWCSSLYKDYPYKPDDGRENLTASGQRVLRGGSWNYNPDDLRCAGRLRNNPTYRSNYVGFRCAQDGFVKL